MRNITIKDITLLNFKGIRELSVDLFRHETSLMGKNGSGKTTIFDAFTWLLFGKDSNDSKNFNLRTLDKTGKPIEHLPHEVSATIFTDGQTVKLRKCFVEKWTKKRGSAVEEYSGNKTEQYVNDVPCSVTEYGKKIAELFASEDIFKLITNPLYFPAQKKDFQRAMLFRMAGDVTNDDIAALRPEFAMVAEALQTMHMSVEDYKKLLQASMKTIKAGMNDIPSRIDERKRTMPEAEDWTAIEAEMQQRREAIAHLEAAIIDRSKAYNEATAKRTELAKEQNELEIQRMRRGAEIRLELERGYNEKVAECNRLADRCEALERSRNVLTAQLSMYNDKLAELNAKRAVLLQEWKDIKNGQKPVFDPQSFVCPTCKRPFAEADIEAKKQEVIYNMIEDNKRKGLSVKAEIEAETEKVKAIEKNIFDIDEELAMIKADPSYGNLPRRPDSTAAVSRDKTAKELAEKIDAIKKILDEDIQMPFVADLQAHKKAEEETLKELDRRLASRDLIEQAQKRIDELEDEYKSMSEELSALEGKEFAVNAFRKAQIEHIEESINHLFRVVRWKMFETQINGGEAETCECTIDGVPFSDLNTASKINAGLDIIRAIQQAEGIKAPIFIDNRESVTEIGEMDCQIINLVVDSRFEKVTVQ